MLLPGGLQNSHRNGGRVFLIFVADPITVRLCTFNLWPTCHRGQRPPCGACHVLGPEVGASARPSSLVRPVTAFTEPVVNAVIGGIPRHQVVT
jgi:hypothetical protein